MEVATMVATLESPLLEHERQQWPVLVVSVLESPLLEHEQVQ